MFSLIQFDFCNQPFLEHSKLQRILNEMKLLPTEYFYVAFIDDKIRYAFFI